MKSVLKIRKLAPTFTANAYFKGFQKLSLEQYRGKWVVLFFYPLDFTFVCPTEIIQFSDKSDEFRKVNCEVLGCSIDSKHTHRQYVNTPRDKGGLGEMKIPLIADVSKQISRDYGVLIEDPEDPDQGIALRGTFIIDANGILKHQSVNDLPVGRNVDEVLRLVQAFQFVEKHGEVCPASWKPGSRTMVPNHDSEKLQSYWKEEHAKNH